MRMHDAIICSKINYSKTQKRKYIYKSTLQNPRHSRHFRHFRHVRFLTLGSPGSRQGLLGEFD